MPLKMIIIKGYKTQREFIPIKSKPGDVIPHNTADLTAIGHGSDAWYSVELGEIINNALAELGLTEADIVSMTVVPWQVNKRDPGSDDYHILCRVP